jgi:hypothetical protein
MRRSLAAALRLACGLALASAACSASPAKPDPGSGGAGSGGAGGGGAGAGSGTGGQGIQIDGGTGGCACAPGAHGDVIFVLSIAAEIWAYDPAANTFALVAPATCGGAEAPYSMAVDRAGRAWVLYADSEDLRTIDLDDPKGCEDPGFTPGQAGFGLFGMAFSSSGPDDPCSKLYAHSYSGAGPFDEGPGAGALGVIDPDTLILTSIGPIDYDGGELAGTADGRLFAFAGVGPAKLVEYDKATAAPIATMPLDGLSKTSASAFAFHRGDVYFFTDAMPPACEPCLEQTCGVSCAADPACAEQLACVVSLGKFTDACGGGLPSEMKDCLVGPCQSSCFVPDAQKVSKVTRLDLDGSEGQGAALTVVNGAAPIRIVGAGVSTCVPVTPQ